MRKLLMLALLLVLPVTIWAGPKSYPLHGTITAVHDRVTSETSSYQQVTGMSRTGQLTHGGTVVGSYDVHENVYTVESDDLIYEISPNSAKVSFELGKELNFRIEKKDHVFVQDGDKEYKCELVGKELKKKPEQKGQQQ